MFCSNCGSNIPDGGLYCPSCGQRSTPSHLEEIVDSSHKTKRINPKALFSKRFILLCVPLLIIVCIICICTLVPSEYKGVPDSVICRDASYDTADAYKYEVIHDVDTAAHIDDAKLKLYYKGTYGTKTIIAPYSYEYSKSNDSWSLLEEGTVTSEQLLNEQAYIDASPWVGECDGYHACSYSITFYEINMDEMYAIISYDIDFKDDSIPDLSNYSTVDLIEGGGSWNLHFLIHYRYDGFLSDEESLWFWLGIDYGLKPF